MTEAERLHFWTWAALRSTSPDASKSHRTLTIAARASVGAGKDLEEREHPLPPRYRRRPNCGQPINFA